MTKQVISRKLWLPAKKMAVAHQSLLMCSALNNFHGILKAMYLMSPLVMLNLSGQQVFNLFLHALDKFNIEKNSNCSVQY